MRAGATEATAQPPVPLSPQALMRPCDVPTRLSEMIQLATVLSTSQLVPKPFQGRPQDILAVMMTARSLNVPLAVALRNLYTPGPGQVGFYARLARALLRRAGHRLSFVEEECDDKRAVVTLQLRGEEATHRVTYTMLEVIALELNAPHRDKNRNYQKQPATMLRHRATMRAVDWYCPEVLLGADLGDDEDALDELEDEVADAELVSGVSPAVAHLLTLIKRAACDDPAEHLNRLRAIWQAGSLVLDQRAAEDGTTLRQTLTEIMNRLQERIKADNADETPPDGATATDTPSAGGTRRTSRSRRTRATTPPAQPETPPAELEATPADEQLLDCDCDPEHVLATGAHQPGCAGGAS